MDWALVLAATFVASLSAVIAVSVVELFKHWLWVRKERLKYGRKRVTELETEITMLRMERARR